MNLYLRLFWIWLRARGKPAIRLGDTIEIELCVLPNDIDVNGHMNNGRYMTIADLALLEYFIRSGFLKAALRRGWRPMLGGSMISFRHGLPPFRRYTLRFTVACWDDRWSYMQFEFVYRGRSMAMGYAKGAAVGRQGIVGTADISAALGIDPVSPPIPAGIAAWIAADRLIRNA